MNVGQRNSPNSSPGRIFPKSLTRKRFWIRWRLMIILMMLVFVIMLVSSVSFYWGATAHRQHMIRGQFLNAVTDIIDANYHIPINYIRSWFSIPDKISIDMKFKHLQRMTFNKESALKDESITENKKDITFPANLTFNNKKVGANISLYGSYLDHINSNQYSMRINVKNNSIMGIRKFVLMNPKVRYGLYDWLGHKLMKFEDLIYLRYQFINVSLNGEDKGVYVLEELFDKILIENNQHRDGLIIRPVDPIKIYREEKLLSDPSTKNSVYLIKKLFKSFREGMLPPKQLIDYESMSRFMAVIKLLGGEHALLPSNIRFFLNPITLKLEPIGREFNIKSKIYINIFQDHFYKFLMADPEFVKLYVGNLIRITQPEYLDNFFSKIDLELQQSSRFIHRQKPYHTLDKNFFYQQQKIITQELTSIKENVKTFYEFAGNKLKITFQNTSNYQIQISSLLSNSKKLDNLFSQALDSNTIISFGKKSMLIRIPENISQEISDSLISMGISLKIVGSSNKFNSLVLPSKDGQAGKISFDLLGKVPNPAEFPFLRLNEENKEINIIKGDWTIIKDMILPSGYIVKSSQGTKLDLKNGASIVSYSPFKFYGTENEPIIIQSADGTGKGIVVLNTGNIASKLYHVVFQNLAKPEELGWKLTSSVTFYESDVHLDKSHFMYNRDSDDALNIFRSEFSINRTKFAQMFADALDIDFSKGDLTDVIFFECGTKDNNGDCLDISGSTVNLNRIFIDGAGDKALSIGEKSSVVAKNISISNSTIAVASKDSSEIFLEDLSIRTSSFAFAAYQKKLEFGPGRISANNFYGEEIGTLHLLEKGSSLILNDGKIDQFSEKHPLEVIKIYSDYKKDAKY